MYFETWTDLAKGALEKPLTLRILHQDFLLTHSKIKLEDLFSGTKGPLPSLAQPTQDV